MNVSLIAPVTSAISSPVMNRAMSMMCALRSPWAPDPACLPLNRQSSGVSGPPQSCRYFARTWKIRPSLPSLTIWCAIATAGTRRYTNQQKLFDFFAFFAACAIVRASSSVPAKGFSQAMCLPASRAAIACGACRWLGVTRSTRSISSLLKIASVSAPWFCQPHWSAKAPSVGSNEQIECITGS